MPRLSTRLALASAAVVCAAVGGFAVGAYAVIENASYDRIDRSLNETAARVDASLARSDIGVRDFSAVPGRGVPAAPALPREVAPPDARVQISEDGRPVPGGTAPGASPLPVGPPAGPRTIRLEGEPYRLLVYALPASAAGRTRTLAVARPLADVEATLRQTALILTAGALLASLAAVALALVIVRRALRPLIRVQATAERVAASEDLSVRIEEGPQDEVGRLAAAVNRMLARLEETQGRLRASLQEQRRFAADASHELRTPLTALRGDIELLRRHRLPEEEQRQVLDEMTTSADRMGRLVAGLLGLMRLEATEPGDGAEQVHLADLLRELAEPGEGPVVAPGAADLVVRGQPDALRGLFVNIIDNGRRHGGGAHVTVRAEGSEAVVEVSDQGPGIAPEDRERVFDRFYRAASLRSTPGAGLGLAIARAAAERAGGTLRLLPSVSGARFEVRLPAQRAVEPAEEALAHRPG